MARLGEQLRARRESKGITREQAATDTRIRAKFLHALEAGDYQTLPGAVYTKGFLRNYAEYLDLDADELTALYQVERGGAEPPRTFQPMRPLMRRNLVLTPAVLVPVVVFGAVALFVGYLYYQFTAFAVQPRLDVVEPAGAVIAQRSEFVVRGVTIPNGRVTVRVFPGPETIADIRPAADGTFSTTVQLRPGTNHIEVEVLDTAGKQASISRTVLLELPVAGPEQAPQLIVEQPANGGTYTNAPVTVSGRVDRSVTSVLVNGEAVPATDGRFSVTVTYTAGPQTVRVVAKTATGGEVQETRTISVTYTAAFVTVRVRGGQAWLLATIDGAQAPNTNRVFTDGQTITLTGRQVNVRTGNAGATYVTYNGQDLGAMGQPGQVLERAFQ